MKHLLVLSIVFCLLLLSVEATAQLSNTPWPKPGKDARNSSFGGSVPVAIPYPKWIVPVTKGAENQGVMIDLNGNVVFKTPNYEGQGSAVVSVNETGVVWERLDEGSWDWGTTVAANDVLYVQNANWGAGGSDVVRAIDPATGATLWSPEMVLGAANDSSVTVGSDGTIYVNGDSRLTAITDTGSTYSVSWSVPLPNDQGVGCIGLYEGFAEPVVYVSNNNNMLAIQDDGASGSMIWSQGMGRTWRHPAIGSDGTLYLSHFTDDYPTWPETLLAFNGSNGNVLWSVATQQPNGTIPGNHFSLCSLNGAEDSLYFGAHGDYVLAFTTAGALKWSWEAPEGRTSEISASPTVIENGGSTYIYVPSHDGWIYCLKDETTQASLQWSFQADSGINGQAAVDGDGTVYFSSTSSNVYALYGYPTSLTIVTWKELPSGYAGYPYSQTLMALGGTEPYKWTVTAGAPPGGVTLDLNTGELSGDPDARGTYNFTVKCEETGDPNEYDEKQFTLEVLPTAVDIITLSVHNGAVGEVYDSTTFKSLRRESGTYTWTKTGDTIPGLSFSPSGRDYVLSGTPATAGEYMFTLKVEHSGDSSTNEYFIKIVEDPSPWDIKACNPNTFPYQYVEVEDSMIYLYNTDPGAGWSWVQNFSTHAYQFGSTAANGKIYCAIGWKPTWRQELSPPGTGVREYFDNRYAYFAIYNADTDVWDPAYHLDFHPLALLPGGYADHGTPTGFNNGRGTERTSAGTATTGGHALGISGARDQVFGYDFDSDGTDEIFVQGGYPNWGGLAYIYDPNTNAWRTTGTGWRDGSGGGTWLLHEPSATAYLVTWAWFASYDIVADSWTTINDSGVNPLPFSVSGHTGAVIGDKMYLVDAGVPNVLIYDITAGTWDTATGATVPTPVDAAKTVVYNDMMYVVGGTKAGLKDLVQRYHPPTNSWAVLDIAIPEATKLHVAGIVDGVLYVSSGDLGTGFIEDIRSTTWAIPMDVLDAPVTPAITDVERGSNIKITFTTVPTQTYRVESSTSPYDYDETNMTWADEQTGIVGAVGELTWEDTNTPTSGEKYYRVYAELEGDDLKAVDTVGMMVLAMANARNMVSSPFEPYPDYDSLTFLIVDEDFEDNTDGRFESANCVLDFALTNELVVDTFTPGQWIYFWDKVYQAVPAYDPAPPYDFTGAQITFDVKWVLDTQGDTRDFTNQVVFHRIYSGIYNEGSMTWSLTGYEDWSTAPVSGENDVWVTHAYNQGEGNITNYEGGVYDPSSIYYWRWHCTDWSYQEGYTDEIHFRNYEVREPFRMGESTLDKIVGNQLTGHPVSQWAADQVSAWDADAQTYILAWLRAGQGWRAWDSMDDPPTFHLSADKGYWFTINNTPTNVTFFGRVAKENRSIPLLANRNMVGTCFPVSCPLTSSNLVGSGFTGHPVSQWASDKLEFWNAAGQTYVGVWYRAGQGWRAWDSMDNPPAFPYDAIDPGEGWWLTVNNTPFTWTYKVPPRPVED